MDLDLQDLRSQIQGEKPDHTAKELDKVWEEEMVNFMDNAQSSSCGTAMRPAEEQRRDQYIPLNTDLLTVPDVHQGA